MKEITNMLLKKRLTAVVAVAALAAGFMMVSPLAAHATDYPAGPFDYGQIDRHSSLTVTDLISNLATDPNYGWDFSAGGTAGDFNGAPGNWDLVKAVITSGSDNTCSTNPGTIGAGQSPDNFTFKPTAGCVGSVTITWTIGSSAITPVGDTYTITMTLEVISTPECGDNPNYKIDPIDAYQQGADATSGSVQIPVPINNVNAASPVWTLTVKAITSPAKDKTVGMISTTTSGKGKVPTAVYEAPANYVGSDAFTYTLSYTDKAVKNSKPVTCNVGTISTTVIPSFGATLSTDVNTALSISANDLFAANTGFFPLPTKGNANISVNCYPIQASKNVVKTLGSISPLRKAVKADALLTFTPATDFTGVDHFWCEVTVGKTMAEGEVIVNVGPVEPEPTPEPTPAPAPAPKPDNGGGAAGPGAPTGGSVQSGGIAGLAGVVILGGLAAGTVVLRRRAVATH